MPRDARFWRNVIIIGVAHIALLITLGRWNREARSANVPSIVWMNSGAVSDRAPSSNTPPEEPASTPEPEATPSPEKEEVDESPKSAPAKSEMALPTPERTPKPKATAAPKVSPKPTPRKIVAAKPLRPLPKKETRSVEKPKTKIAAVDSIAKRASDAESGSTESAGRGSGASRAAEFSWYANMLHDRFHSEWAQPTTVVAAGAKISALVKIRIEKDGRVSSFTIVKPSGNVVVDESVASVAKRVTHVDPLPQGLVSGDHYEVKINFELNPEK
ncbi:MAG TPA: TonB family protein [Chthoniobacterales bacterium]|jgi:protein TonB